jgi:hypothetical protein
MTNYNPARSTHQTLTANSVDVVTLVSDSDVYPAVEVLNRSTAYDIYFTVNGSAPTVGGDNCLIVQAGQALTVQTVGVSGVPQVRLISAGAAAYSVTAV